MSSERPLVVLCGPIHPDAHARLAEEARVVLTEETTEDAVVRIAAEADGILFRAKPRCSESLIRSCKRLKVIGRHGVGLDIVDLPAATRLGIPVVHAPGSNSQAVAEHAIMLMLMCAKSAREVDQATRAGEWATARTKRIVELGGRTLGIVGVGNIGRRVAKFAGAMGMRVLGYDPYVPADELRRRGAEPTESLDALLREADVLTCHTPLTDETHHMIDERTLGLMKPGAILINCSRGPVHDERAVFEALVRGRLGAAGLDVWEDEPTSRDNPMLNLDNVVCTSHVAGVTQEAHRAIGFALVEEMLRVLRGERPRVLGNPELWPKLSHLR